jgi:acetylornithine deacetylase/succinyl-diaminopimelate desuccinylase-like protein
MTAEGILSFLPLHLHWSFILRLLCADPCWLPKARRANNEEEVKAVESFRQFLRIPSVSSFGTEGSYRSLSPSPPLSFSLSIKACVCSYSSLIRAAATFLSDLCRENGISLVRAWEGVPNKPIVIASVLGTEPVILSVFRCSSFSSSFPFFHLLIVASQQYQELPSILLNSHYDVVPVILSEWKYDPFDGHLDQ